MNPYKTCVALAAIRAAAVHRKHQTLIRATARTLCRRLHIDPEQRDQVDFFCGARHQASCPINNLGAIVNWVENKLLDTGLTPSDSTITTLLALIDRQVAMNEQDEVSP